MEQPSTARRRAGVGVATFYRRFPTRSALLAAAFDDQFAKCATVFEEALADSHPGHGLYTLLETACTTLVTDRGFDAVFMTGFPETRDYDRERACAETGLTNLVQRALDAGQLRKDEDNSRSIASGGNPITFPHLGRETKTLRPAPHWKTGLLDTLVDARTPRAVRERISKRARTGPH
ncbi:TetR/AcrR family transcriptional regulator [Streptomyces sp. AD16]|nr:TetR/AcrR family transcriptional regulator [Streptomyces sp. AD16]